MERRMTRKARRIGRTHRPFDKGFGHGWWVLLAFASGVTKADSGANSTGIGAVVSRGTSFWSWRWGMKKRELST